jgi:AraC-like DNA-binding protein
MNNNLLYAYKAISRFSGSVAPFEQMLHTHFSWMLVGLGGTGKVRMEEQEVSIPAGSACLGSPGSFMLHLEQGAGTVLFIEFTAITLTGSSAEWRMEEHASPYAALRKRASNAGELAVLADRLFTVMSVHPEPPQRSLTGHMLIQRMMLWWHSDGQKERMQQSTTDQAILAAQQDMEAYYTDTLTREQLAGKAGIANTYFSVRFKLLIGSSPSDYLERLRVHRACELLLQRDEIKPDLTEISRRSGFRDPWYMSKRFRKVQGVSPSAYRSGFIPERAAALEYPYAYHLIALGIIPCAARFCSYNYEVIDPAVREAVPDIPWFASIEGEKRLLAESGAQVILTSSMDHIQNRFRGLAPVIYIPWLSLNWREHLRTISRLFRREAEAVAYIQALERQAEQTKRLAHAAIGPEVTVSIFKIEDKRCYVYGNRDTGCIFYECLGYMPHVDIRQRLLHDPNFHSMEISLQKMAHYASELNFIILTPDAEEQMDWLRMDEHWIRFEASGKHPLVYLDYREWLHYDPINIAAQLQKIPRLFETIVKAR